SSSRFLPPAPFSRSQSTFTNMCSARSFGNGRKQCLPLRLPITRRLHAIAGRLHLFYEILRAWHEDHAMRLPDKTGNGHDVPVVVSDCVRRVRRYAVRSARSLCRGKNKSRNDVDRVICWIGQINDVTECLFFDGDTVDIAVIDLLHGDPCNNSGRLERRSVRDYNVMWGQINNFHSKSSLFFTFGTLR